MLLTTKSRYAVMALVDVAERGGQKPVKLADISESQLIPLRYLEQIFLKLKKADLVIAVKGPGGGYLLNGGCDISIVRIIDAVEENTKMTRCSKGKTCVNSVSKCKTHDLWKGLGSQIRGYLSSISISDVLNNKISL